METLLKLPDVEKKTTLRRSNIYAKVKRGEFPAPIKLGRRASAWKLSEIEAWIASLTSGASQ